MKRLARLWPELAAGALLAAVALFAVHDFRARAHGGRHGLRGRYFANASWQGEPFLERIDARLDFHPGNHRAFAEPGGISVEWAGWIWLPRGGAYKFGLEADQAAELLIDDVMVLDSRAAGPLEIARKVLPAGGHRIVIRYLKGQASGFLRMTWLPPGRRGDMEYVPGDILAPTPNPLSGAPPRDALLAWAVVAAALLLGAVRARAALRGALAAVRRDREARRVLALAGGLFMVALVVRLVGLMQQGQTWDEDVYWSSGKNYLENLLAWDFRAASWRWNFEHPPVTKYLAGLGALSADSFAPARVLFALVSAATVLPAFAIARRWFTLAQAAGAAAAVALTPHLIAHARVIGHETPSVFLWTTGVWLLLVALERRQLAAYLGAGVIAGLAVGVRYPNGLLFVLYAVIVLLHRPRPLARRDWIALAAIPVVALLVFVAIWPRMWAQPIGHVLESWRKIKKPHGRELFLGAFVERQPLYYFPVYLVATAPAGILAGVAAFAACARAHARPALTLLAWLLVPLGIALSPVVQDGVRYILPALVPLAMAAGAGIVMAGERLARLRPRLRPARIALPALAALYLVVTLARIYPYYLDYYGEQVGGPRTALARRWFEVGWWGEGITAAMQWIDAHAPPHTRVGLHVIPNHFTWRRHDLWIEPMGALDGDLVVHNRLAEQPLEPPGWTVVHEVRAQGAPLVRVLARPGLDLTPYR